jgi:hypothetical protein
MKTQLVGSSTRLALLILAVASTGCLVIPVKENEVTSGRKLKTEETAGWRIGETKRAEVLQQLGRPYAEFLDLNVIAYEWIVVSAIMPWFVAGGYSAAGGVEDIRQEHLLLVGFDEAERVAKFEVVHHNFGRLHNQAKRWTASLAVPGDRIAGSGKSTASSDDTALLYVYRPGGWSEGINMFLVRILLDGKLAAELNRHSFACISVPPGSHTIAGWMRAYPSDATDFFAFTAPTNAASYLEAKVASGTGKDRGRLMLRLRLVAPESGREAIRKMKNVGAPLPGSL